MSECLKGWRVTMKLNFHFPLLRARLPEIYDEAKAKDDLGVKRVDIMNDLLLELHWRRQLSPDQIYQVMPEQKQSGNGPDFNEAISVMDKLSD